MSEIKTIKLMDIQVDDEIYPREHIDPTNVNDLRTIMESGKELDPIVVCKIRGRDKYTLVDGNHRIFLYSDKGLINVKVEDLGVLSKLEAWKESVRRNQKRGPLPLSKSDRERSAMLGLKLGASENEAATLTFLPLSLIRSLPSIVVTTQGQTLRVPRAFTKIDSETRREVSVPSSEQIRENLEEITKTNRRHRLLYYLQETEHLLKLIDLIELRKEEKRAAKRVHDLLEEKILSKGVEEKE